MRRGQSTLAADRKFTLKPDPYVRNPEFTIRNGKHKGHVLREGDWLRFFNQEGAWKFKYAVKSPSGSEWVSAYGGNAKDPMGENSWRSFPLDAEFIPTKSKRKGE